MPGRLELREVAEGQIRFELTAGQRQFILTGELCRSTAIACARIDALRVHARDNKRYERCESPQRDLYFLLRSGDGQLIGTNPIYASRAAWLLRHRNRRHTRISEHNCTSVPSGHRR